MRSMSFALTTEQVRARTKTVTRRIGWTFLKPGYRIRAVVKCMGLKKGEKVEPLAVLRVVDVRREPLSRMLQDKAWGWAELAAEGFADHPDIRSPASFVSFFCGSHRVQEILDAQRNRCPTRLCTPGDEVTRIEFTYEDETAPRAPEAWRPGA